MRIVLTLSAFFLLALVVPPFAGAAQPQNDAICPTIGSGELSGARMALVIGNSSYAMGALQNPINDATLIAQTLSDLGFSVRLLCDLSNRDMFRAVVQYANDLRAAGEDTIGFFYYAGHAVHTDRENYLIPVDGNIRDEIDLPPLTLSMSDVMAGLRKAGNRTNIVVLDACRNNPFAGINNNSIMVGLAKITPPKGTLVAYSAAPGQTATDGTGSNSPYSHALAQAIRMSDVEIEQTFKRVRIRVLEITGDNQLPVEESSLTEEFFFNRQEHFSTTVETEKREDGESNEPEAEPQSKIQIAAVSPEANTGSATTTTRSTPVETADQMWQRIQNSKIFDDFVTYLDHFPNGRHSKRVEARMASFSR